VIPCAGCGADNDSTAHTCAVCGAQLDNPAARALLGSAILGIYELTDIVGKGGMSIVYKARHKMTDQVVALKILPAELAVHADIKARFIEEAKALAKLEHPNIVRLYNFGEENGRFVLAMQYVEGSTFEQRIFSAGRLDWRDATAVACQVLAALDFAHARGIVHRDIKPSNVLVRDDASAMVMDFGIAKMAEGSARLTATGQTMGTVRYMSPEQVRGHVLDHRSDLYSVGATLYEAVVGDTPFDGATHFEIMMKHLNEAVPSPRQHIVDIPPALDAAIRRALSKSAADRYQNAAQFLEALEAVLTAAGVAVPPRRPRVAERPLPLPDEGSKITGIATVLESGERRGPRRRRRLILATPALCGVAAVAVAAAVWSPRARPVAPVEPAEAEALLVAGFKAVVDRTFETPERVRILAARELDAEKLALAYAAARQRFAAWVRQRAGVDIAAPPLTIVVAPAKVICSPELHQGPLPADCAARPPHFAYPPRRATLYVLDDAQLESVNLAEGASAHLCIHTPALLELRCMRNFLPPYWDEVERTR
jgi:tRNA A-37 threonylcarbamoyl transferase component Bud32